jgi:hypothetical protein
MKREPQKALRIDAKNARDFFFAAFAYFFFAAFAVNF